VPAPAVAPIITPIIVPITTRILAVSLAALRFPTSIFTRTLGIATLPFFGRGAPDQARANDYNEGHEKRSFHRGNG
jgi:hypothetical protein